MLTNIICFGAGAVLAAYCFFLLFLNPKRRNEPLYKDDSQDWRGI